MKSPESPTSPLSYQDSNNNNNSHRTNGNGQKSAPTTSSSINRHSSKAMNISQYFQSMCYANAVKESKNEKIGLVVKRSPVWNSIYISAIKESSKFADSKLEVGMVILAINGIKCPNTVKAIQKVMKDCEGDLTIVAASISPEIDVTATTTTSTTTTGTSPATSPTNVETKQEEDPTPKPVVLTPDVPDVQDDVFEDDDGPELIDDEEHPHNVSKSSSIGFDDLSVGPETIDDDIHPDKAVNSVSQESAFANVVPQDSGADDALEMVLTEEKDEAAGVGAAATFQDSFSSSELPSAHSSTSDFSNTPTPRRRVMKSMRDDSPVRVSSIDHTGGIIVTPKTSPSNDTQQQAHEQQHYEDDAPEEKKEAPEDLEKDRTRFDHSPKRMEADLYERKQSPEEVLHVGRSDRKMAPHEVEADRNYDDVERNNQAAEELEVAPMATRRAAQRRNSEDRDYAIKREARRSTHMAVMGQSTQPPPPTRPGAYAVSSRPSVSKGGGGARSSSPVPQAAYTSNDDDVKRRALPPTGPARLPGAQRVAGPSARLGASPEVQNLQPSSVPRRGSHLSEEMSLGSTGSTRHSGGASIGSAQQRSVGGGGGVPNSPGAVSAGSAPPPSKTQRSPELTKSPSTAVARNTGVPLSQHAAGITDQVPTPGLADSDDEGSDDGMPGAQRVAGMHGRTSERFETADTFPTGGSASVDDGAFSQNSRYAPTTASAPHTTTGAAPAFSGVGVGVPLHSGATSVVSSVSSCTFDDHHTTLSGDYTRRGSAEISRRGSAEISRRGSAEFARRGSADQNSLPAVKSEDYEDNVEEEEALVIAAVVQDDPDVIAERIRQQIMLETARADVVVMERDDDEDEDSDFESTRRQEELKKHKPKNVREKLFGDKKSRDVSMDLDYAPDQYIRKRDLLPCSVKRNETTDMWVASVVTNQKAWEDNDKKELERTRVTFSGKTRTEATEAGLAMGTPILQAFSDNPICFMCKAKFAVFNRPNNCKNCGVVICNKCTCLWSSKRFPETYPISKSSHSACLACDWSANKFQEALLKGDHAKAVKLYESGNVNLRCPFVPKKQKSEEVMYPIHMAIIGGNIHSVRWLVSEHFCPLQVDVRTKGKMKAVPLETSKGRSPVRLAITQKNEDILKFLISEQGLSLFQEDLKNEFKWVLAHLTNTLYRVPYESPPVAAAPSPQKVTELDLEAKVELACNASATVCSPASAASAASAESTLADF